MAITKIYTIKNRLDKRVRYALNEKKTGLDGMIDYAVNPNKTEQRLFESALNCQRSSAYQDMMRTKVRFDKTGGIQGFHFIQSFAPGEVTPEQAHALGMEFTRRLFGDRFEAVIGTHLDKEHLHNHIIVNSVSFVDGKKYRSNITSYYKEVRAVSDAICQEHGLSVVNKPERGKHYAAWDAEQKKKPTIRSQIRTDIDGMIGSSLNFTTFLQLMKKNGYEVKYGRYKHTAVRPPYSKRFIRLDSLGAEYTDEAIEQRILRQQVWRAKPKPIPLKHYRYRGRFSDRKRHTGFAALYWHYVYLLRGAIRGNGNRRVSRLLLEDTLQFDRYLAQHKLLYQNHIETTIDLTAFRSGLEERIDRLVLERKPLYEQRRYADESKKEGLSQEITTRTAQLKLLRRDLKLCLQIEADTERIYARVLEAQKLVKEEMNHEPRQRSRRADDKRSYPNLRVGSETGSIGSQEFSGALFGAGQRQPEDGRKNQYDPPAEKRERTQNL